MKHRVLISGCGGAIGRVLSRRLSESPQVEELFGLDRAAPAPGAPAALKLIDADPRDASRLKRVLADNKINALFHFAEPARGTAGAVQTFNAAVETSRAGAAALLEAAGQVPGVEKVFIGSSAWVYGCRPGNPLFLTEDFPMKSEDQSRGHFFRRLEERLKPALADLRPGLQCSILRIGTLAGQMESGGGLPRRLFAWPFGLALTHKRSEVQILSEEDLAANLLAALGAREFRGVYNVVPDDYTTLDAVYQSLRRRQIQIPAVAAHLIDRLGRYRYPEQWESIASPLAYPVVANNAKIKKALRVPFQHGSRQALSLYLSSRGSQSSDLLP